MKKVPKMLRALVSVLLLTPALGWTAPQLQPINLQLRWVHQFQFAGYYMAKEKGFYQQEGLDVTIRLGGPGITPAREVLDGRAQYGVGNMEVLSLYHQGEPLVALAALYQHSPSILLVRQDSDIYTVGGLKGKRVMLYHGENDPEILSMLRVQGLTADDIQRLDSSTDINDLINGNTDAFNAYVTNEPFYMQEKGVGVRIINPRDYGIDFYSDVLFTTQQELQGSPKQVEAFRRASLEGWFYALNHPEETIHVLVNNYRVTKTLDHLRYESNMVREMVMPEFVELGYMSETRWQQMTDRLAALGIVKNTRSLQDFIYMPESRIDWHRWIVWVLAALCLLINYFLRFKSTPIFHQ